LISPSSRSSLGKRILSIAPVTSFTETKCCCPCLTQS
jgi:hypothetical protein